MTGGCSISRDGAGANHPMWRSIDEDGNDLVGWVVGLLGFGATGWFIWDSATTLQQGLFIGSIGLFVTMCAVFIARHDRLWFWNWW